MTPEEKRYLAEVHKMIGRFKEPQACQPDDVTENELNDLKDAFPSIILQILPAEARRVLAKSGFEEQVNALMDELSAVGALERVHCEAGMPTYRYARHWSKEESDLVWARVEAQMETTPTRAEVRKVIKEFWQHTMDVLAIWARDGELREPFTVAAIAEKIRTKTTYGSESTRPPLG